MKIIIINSRKHGIKEVLVDDEDFEELSKYTWHIDKGNKTFYALRYIEDSRKRISMHRQLLGLTISTDFGDHLDENGLNNQRGNLRKATKAQNMMNRKSNIGSSSKYIGVSWQAKNKKWVSTICFNAKTIYIGLFKTEIEAAHARDIKSKIYFGEFAKLNVFD